MNPGVSNGVASPGFPESVDSTMCNALMVCPQRFYYEFIRWKRPKGSNLHLHGGAAFARGLEVARKAYYLDGLDAERAFNKGFLALVKHYGMPEEEALEMYEKKTCAQFAKAYIAYFDRYVLGADPIKPIKLANSSSVGIEFTFAISLDIAHPVTGNPILYTGRCDMIGELNNSVWAVDEKTCSQMGPGWANKWDMRGQFIGYTIAARMHKLDVVGGIVRGVCLLMTETRFGEAIVTFTNAQCERWWHNLHLRLARAIEMWKQGFWELSYGDACEAYGGCVYKRLCGSDYPEGFMDIYYQDFKWDPLWKEEN